MPDGFLLEYAFIRDDRSDSEPLGQARPGTRQRWSILQGDTKPIRRTGDTRHYLPVSPE
jgi:hypothetical protein